jgi:hypothetical protein
MSYNLKKILQTISSEKTFGDKFLFYDEKEKVCCYNFWCYNVIEQNVKISDIDYCEVCNEDKEDDSKDYIIVENNDINMIISGYNKYKSVKKRYGNDHITKVLKIKKIKKVNFLFFIKNMSFRIFVVSPLKFLYKIFK